jgi:hypothetical protein
MAPTTRPATWTASLWYRHGTGLSLHREGRRCSKEGAGGGDKAADDPQIPTSNTSSPNGKVTKSMDAVRYSRKFLSCSKVFRPLGHSLLALPYNYQMTRHWVQQSETMNCGCWLQWRLSNTVYDTCSMVRETQHKQVWVPCWGVHIVDIEVNT